MNYEKLLEGKTAVVTDADNAVGKAVARLFARHGAAVALGVKDLREGYRLVSEISGLSKNSFAAACDLSDAESVENFCLEVKKRWELVNALVNDPWLDPAAVLPFERATDFDDSLILQVYQHSVVQTCRAFWPAMIAHGRCAVVNISSSSVFKAAPGALLFTMANGALGGLTRVPAVEGGIHEVRVNEIFAGFGVNGPECAKAPLKRGAAASRPDIDGVANTALFLASDMASYVSGVSISASGGAQRMRYAALN
ncbi:MAG: SDR family oxidoreductase [Clostridiales bacterium]|nr:SDR family oxidoreductase [Clostridiales bacterium]